MIDKTKPNVVVVLTSADDILRRKNWKDRLDQKKLMITRALADIVGIKAPVVCIENDPEEESDIERGDFTQLANGVLQPKNLYETMAHLLADNGDDLGHLALNFCFTEPTSVHVKIPEGFRMTKITDCNPRLAEIQQELQKNRNVGADKTDVFKVIDEFLKKFNGIKVLIENYVLGIDILLKKNKLVPFGETKSLER